MNSVNSDYDLVIVGMGPVGATAALLFAEAGLRTAVIERDHEVYRLPRAVNLDGEIVRAYQRIGRGEAVDALMQSVRPGERAGFANSKREWLFGTPFVEFGANGWQPMNMFDQPELENYMRSEAMAHPLVTTYLGYVASSPRDNGTHVEVSAESSDTRETITLSGRYLVGCDGAASLVRRTLNTDWHNLGYDHDWLVVDVTLKPGHTLSHETLQVCDPDRLVTYVCTKDPYRRWEFRMNEGETAEDMLNDKTIHALIQSWTPDGTYEIRRKAVYQFHAATATSWRESNIFIAGDAAHQTPPFLGQGMNAGLRDVINLSWKFPLVLSGLASADLLDTYQQERDAHARDLVQWAVAIGQLMEHQAAIERAATLGEPPPKAAESLRSSGYGQGRAQPPLRDGAIIVEQVSDTGATGYLFSQPIVRNTDGHELRLDELLGSGFALVTKDAANLTLSSNSRHILEKLEARIVSLAQLTEVRGHFDRCFSATDTVLVRPDRIVFGHTTDTVSADELVTALAEKLHTTFSQKIDKGEFPCQ